MTSGVNFDWLNYLELARELAQNTENQIDEARVRSSISRAYYACFCKARNYLRDIEQDPSLKRQNYMENVHQYVAEEFKGKRKKELRQIGETLSRLRRNRNNADYEDFVGNLPSKVKITLEQAEQVISLLNTCINPLSN